MNHATPFLLFAFAALGFVWSVEACASVIMRLLGF
jgi:hypothetical protein